VSKLVARYRAEGEAAFAPRSRRPKTSPMAIPEQVARLTVQLRKGTGWAGPGSRAGDDLLASGTSPSDSGRVLFGQYARD